MCGSSNTGFDTNLFNAIATGKKDRIEKQIGGLQPKVAAAAVGNTIFGSNNVIKTADDEDGVLKKKKKKKSDDELPGLGL